MRKPAAPNTDPVIEKPREVDRKEVCDDRAKSLGHSLFSAPPPTLVVDVHARI